MKVFETPNVLVMKFAIEDVVTVSGGNAPETTTEEPDDFGEWCAG